jgi:DNA-binding MarR family transcriptional regulator
LTAAVEASFGVGQPAATTLAVLDGAGGPLTPSQISERMLVASASTTTTLDLLERRGRGRRMPNPRGPPQHTGGDHRRGPRHRGPSPRRIRILERDALDQFSPRERCQLLTLLDKVLTRLAELSDAPPIPLEGRRNRSTRLEPPAV